MDKINDYLPLNKCDYDSIEKLKTLNIEQVQLLVPGLLLWIQDINWPIASDIINILIPLDVKLVPELKKILISEDFEWIENCLWHLIRKLKKETILELKEELTNLSLSNNLRFIEYNIPQIAKDILNNNI